MDPKTLRRFCDYNFYYRQFSDSGDEVISKLNVYVHSKLTSTEKQRALEIITTADTPQTAIEKLTEYLPASMQSMRDQITTADTPQTAIEKLTEYLPASMQSMRDQNAWGISLKKASQEEQDLEVVGDVVGIYGIAISALGGAFYGISKLFPKR